MSIFSREPSEPEVQGPAPEPTASVEAEAAAAPAPAEAIQKGALDCPVGACSLAINHAGPHA